MKAQDLQDIQAYGAELGGVFSMPDLKVIFAGHSDPGLFKKLQDFVSAGVLVKVKRGFYALPSTGLEVVSQRLAPESYISCGTVLARALLIGSIPARRVQAVRAGRPRTYKCALGVIEHLSLKPELCCGFSAAADGVNYACPEKAFLDACYFFFKGRRFSFDLHADVDLAALDRNLIADFLEKFDRRFISFFRSHWSL